MAYLSRLVVFCLILGSPLAASAQPSFNCNGQLTRTERTICGSQRLAKLDLQMYELYRDKYRSLAQAPKRRLKARQNVWLKWRDTCGRGKDCLTRRYNERIRDFKPKLQVTALTGTVAASGQLATAGASPPQAGPDVVVDRRIGAGADGIDRYEVAYGDRRIEWEYVGGGKRGVDYPDGRKEVYSFNQVVVEGFPSLPGDYSDWGSAVEDRLLSVIDTLLPEDDRNEYRSIHGDKNYSVRVLTHIKVLEFLIGS